MSEEHLPLLHLVWLAMARGSGQSAELPEQKEAWLHSVASLHVWLTEGGTNWHVYELQHGPCDGLRQK